MSSTAATPPAETRPAYDRLTNRERRFVDLLVRGKRAGDAAIEVGYKGGYPADAGYKMKTRPIIREALQEREAMWMDACDVGRAMIVNELAAVGFFDPRKLVDENGAMRPMHELDSTTAAAIQSVEIHEEYEDAPPKDDERFLEPRLATGRTVKVKVAGKVEALKELAGIYGLRKEDAVPVGAPIGPGLTVIVQQGNVVQQVVVAQGPLQAPEAGDTYEHLGMPPPGKAA